MARPRARHAPIALASNGLLLVNVLELLAPEEAQKIRSALPSGLGKDWFVGVPAGSEAEALITRLDDAAAEGVAKTAVARRAAKAGR